MKGKNPSQGGKVLETIIRSMQLREFTVVSHADYRADCSLFPGHQRLLVKNYPYTTIYGTPGRREYFIDSPEFTGELECKFQNTGGSTDEKMVYLTETLRRSDLQNLVVVHAGQYWETPGTRGSAIIEWLAIEALAIRKATSKQLIILDVDGFITWVRKTFK